MTAMLVYPDSSDLIQLERDDGSLAQELMDWLLSRKARAVLSATTISEIAQPFHTASRARVMSLLNRLEALPHIWFRSVDMEKRELETAIRCYAAGSSWEPVVPFVESYLDTLDLLPPVVRAFYRGRSLAEIVWDLLDGERRIRPSKAVLEDWLNQNRAAILATDEAGYQRQLRVAFGRAVSSVASQLPTFQTVPAEDFVEHLWTHPDWCPGAQLSFDVSQRFQADTATRGRSSDIEDLVRVKALPYVDMFVADASKRSYLAAVKNGKSSRLRACSYWTRCTVIGRLDEAYRAAEAK